MMLCPLFSPAKVDSETRDDKLSIYKEVKIAINRIPNVDLFLAFALSSSRFPSYTYTTSISPSAIDGARAPETLASPTHHPPTEEALRLRPGTPGSWAPRGAHHQRHGREGGWVGPGHPSICHAEDKKRNGRSGTGLALVGGLRGWGEFVTQWLDHKQHASGRKMRLHAIAL